MLPHEYKPPSFYTSVEGGDLLPWVYGEIQKSYFDSVEWSRNLSRTGTLPFEICKGIKIHSLLWVRYGDRPEDYVIQERWDCLNGFTDIDPRFPMMKGRDIFRVL
jgi:hypothetical protein